MCRPTMFPHPDAKLQWYRLASEIRARVPICIVEPSPRHLDSVFCRDVGYRISDSVFIRARFRKRDRRGEYSLFLSQMSFPTVLVPPPHATFEGGDVRRVNDCHVLCGYGQRTNLRFVSWMKKRVHFEVTGLHLVNPITFHLDLCLCVFRGESALLVKEAFSSSSFDTLVAMFPDHLLVDMEDRYACNGLKLGSTYVVSHAPKQVQRWLKRRGFTTVLVDCSEFHKQNGGVHCLTND